MLILETPFTIYIYQISLHIYSTLQFLFPYIPFPYCFGEKYCENFEKHQKLVPIAVIVDNGAQFK